MSRGDGRVMRGILAALEREVRLNTRELAAALQGGQGWTPSDEASTRRALRKLHTQGRVYCLGFDAYGSRVWCLPQQAELLTPPWKAKRDALAPTGLGLPESWLARAWNTARLTN